MNEILAVVVTYNRLSILKKCIEALIHQSVSSFDILIINNASTDGTKEYLDIQKKAMCINLDKNYGGAYGFNYGMKFAAERGYKFCWVMDDDCIAKNDALEKLLEADIILRKNECDIYGYLSSYALWVDGTECKMNRHKINRCVKKNENLKREQIYPIKRATFVSLFIPIQIIEKVGLPIKEYFIWGDDIEFTSRISIKHGISGYLIKKSQVIHMMKENVGSNISIDAIERLDRYEICFRNEMYTYKHQGIIGFMYYTYRCLRSAYWILINSKDDKVRRFEVLIKGIIKGLKFNPEIEYVKEYNSSIGE